MVFYAIIAQQGLKKSHLEHLRSKFSFLRSKMSKKFKTYQKQIRKYIVHIIAYNIKTISLLHFFRYVFEVDFTFSNVIIAHVSISWLLCSSIMLQKPTVFQHFRLFYIFILIHLMIIIVLIYRMIIIIDLIINSVISCLS